jgi:tRNA threonylcarbamoyladenosine biosynthesis protein TsaE
MNRASWQCPLPDEGRLNQLAELFRGGLQAPLVIYLRGELGAGKTTFARSLIHALGYSGRVKSPSYGLLETYKTGGLQILHLDLYRIENPAELEYLGLRDLLDSSSVLLVEWPDKGAGFLPGPDLALHFLDAGSKRSVRFTSHTPEGAKLSRRVRRLVQSIF